MSRLCVLAALACAALPFLSQAQQNVPPQPGVLKAIEFKAAKPPVAAARATVDKLALVGKDEDLYGGLELSPAQRARLKANLGQLRCLPVGAPMPTGHVMMQVLPTGGTLGAPGGNSNACMNDAIDAGQLASFREYLRGELKRRTADLAEFDKRIPKDCAFGELQYYLGIVAHCRYA
jgi:hypothetical protein